MSKARRKGERQTGLPHEIVVHSVVMLQVAAGAPGFTLTSRRRFGLFSCDPI